MSVQCECHGKTFMNNDYLQNHLDIEAGILTNQAITSILDAVRKGKGQLEAARVAAGPNGPALWTKRLKGDPLMQEALELAELEFAEKIEESLAERAQEGEFRSQELWLSRRAPDRWAPAANKMEINILQTVKELPLAERKEKLLEMLAARTLADPNIIDAEVVEE